MLDAATKTADDSGVQAEDLRALREEIRRVTGEKWTQEVTARELGVTLSTYQNWEGGRHRIPELVETHLKKVLQQARRRVPLLTSVPAGALAKALEHARGYIELTRDRREGEMLFAWRVTDDSGMQRCVLPGDLVIASATEPLNDRDLAVVRLDEATTLRELRIVKAKPELHGGPNMPRVRLKQLPDLRIAGKVIEVRRTF